MTAGSQEITRTVDAIYFLFVVHNHQPAGNFEHVFAEGWRTCYAPFLELLRRHSSIRCALHFTGPLLEWIEHHQPDAFLAIRELVRARQVELLGGAFYEPVLPSIPREDGYGQLTYMSDYLRTHFGVVPSGLWLAERIWEPRLPSLIRAADLRYTLLDDSHFIYAGLEREGLRGYYLTEDEGSMLAVFPIDKQLRYLVPFSEPQRAIDYLRTAAERHPGCGITLGDDGEKFGMWPGTYTWVYQERYLERLFCLIEESSSWLTLITPSEYLERFPPAGKVYLPTASYDEMMEWALPAKIQSDFKEEIERLKAEGRYEQLSRFLRGGFWRNFLVKYPESNLQRCKAMLVSRMVHTTIPGDMEAKKDLWRSQCNCAYWHGLFGGIYLNYLRHANYSNMLAAEVAVDRAARGVGEWVEADRLDFDHDGADEILLRSSSVNAYISPGYGGSLFELDYKPALFNLCDTLKRSEEPYHAAMLRQEGQKHGRRQLTGALCYDWYLRRSFLDHFLGPGTSPEGFARCSYPEQGGFVNQSYEIESVVPGERMISAGLRRRGVYHAPQGRRHLDIQKTYILHTNGLLEVRYCITNPHDRDDLTLWMGIELTMTLLAGNNADRYLVFGPRAGHQCLAGSRGAVEGVSSVDFVNKRDRFTARVSWDEPSRCWHFPVETVSQSEKGFDLNYQGTAVMPQFLFTLPPGGDKRISFTIGICEV